MNAIAEFFVALLTAIIELLAWLLSRVFSSGYLAAHTKVARRVAHIIGAVCALHLFLGLTIPIFTEFNTYLLSPFFRWQVMLLTLIGLIVSIVASTAIDVAATAKPNPDEFGDAQSEIQPSLVFGLVLIASILFGGLSIFSAQTERKTAREKLCDAAAGRISEDWKARGDKLLVLSEKLLKKDLSGLNPCADNEEDS